MEELPLLILEAICEYLAEIEPSGTSLAAFASSSRAYHTAARRELFSQVLIDVDDAQQFRRRLERLECMLDEARARSCIRVLKVGTYTAYQTRGEDGELEKAWVTSTTSLPKFHGIHALRDRKLTTDPRPNVWWQPLAEFVSSLHLKDLIWSSAQQIPLCVLCVLKSHVPGVQLHVQAFDFRSLHQGEILQNVDDTEYLLASSSSLYSVISPYSMYDAMGYVNYNGEATLRLVAELALNLKHLCVWDSTFEGLEGRTPRLGPGRPKWRGFHPQSDNEWREVPCTKGQLQSLRIDSVFPLTGPQLATWELHTDFSVLTSLRVAGEIELEVLQILRGLVERDELRCLQVLELPAVLCEYEDRGNAESTMTRLLLSLKPLLELSIDGLQNSTFDAVLQQHGNSLRCFRVQDFVLSLPQVKQIRESCPMMENLSLEILRFAGDTDEVEAYQTLGSMRNPETLSMVLQCTDYRFDHDDSEGECLLLGPCFEDEADQKAMAVSIRRVLINAAADESLARSIFQTISKAHTSTKAGLPPKLASIRLKVGGAPILNGQIMDLDFQGVLASIGRSWKYKRDPRDTHQSDFTVEEVNSHVRQRSTDTLEDDMDEFPNSEQYASIWESLWPKTGAGWKEEWRSIPLARQSTSTDSTRLDSIT